MKIREFNDLTDKLQRVCKKYNMWIVDANIVENAEDNQGLVFVFERACLSAYFKDCFPGRYLVFRVSRWGIISVCLYKERL